MEKERETQVLPEPHLISIEFYSKRGNKDEVLINAKDATELIDGKSRWFTYSFVRPVFLTQIEIESDGYASYDRFELEVYHVDNTRHEEKIRVDRGLVRLRLGKLCTSFRFKPDPKFFAVPKLLRVAANGYYEEEFHQFELFVEESQRKLADIVKREEKISGQELAFSNLKAERVLLESEVGKSRAEAEQLTSLIVTSKDQLKKEESRISDVQVRLQTVSEQHRNLQIAIEKEERKLREFVKEVRLFPSEIAGFVKEGNRSINWYIGIGAPFLLILFIILCYLFSSAVNLTQIVRLEEDIDIWTIFLTRIPFVVIAVALIEACGYAVGRLIFEIMRINRQRIEFAKLSIIAKDVSTASAFGNDGLSDSDVFERETKLKMELLREHMKNFVGTEFEYKGTGLVAAIKGVAERMTTGKST